MAERVFKKLLIANRGEIACRVAKTARRLGIRTVGVYSEADRFALHAQAVDEAYCIGPAAAADSYLRGDKILAVAKDSGAEAIHPGYGFLSENAGFAEMCERANVNFIGPPASAIRAMGSKSEAKRIMQAAKVPIVPGYFGSSQGQEHLLQQANAIGYPVLIKAALGGGGKGMKVALNEAEFLDQLASARREAKKSFNDEEVLLEKFILRPRHIEFQVFCDKLGSAVHLFERDCSLQRRHQKVIEEAPSGLSEIQRSNMGESAKAAARAVGYVGAGTIEFIYDQDDAKFYFMEMNTRLQVEHPVTEMITGLDLVEWQIRVAAGHPLPLSQDQIKIKGHAIEARVYAEDPDNGFLPTGGNIIHLEAPKANEHMRIDTGVQAKDDISIFYDPMIAKVVAWGNTREQATTRLISALSNYTILGFPTNLSFLKALLRHQAFASGDFNTKFIEANANELLGNGMKTEAQIAAAGLGVYLQGIEGSKHLAAEYNRPYSPFYSLGSFRLNMSSAKPMHYQVGSSRYSIRINHEANSYRVQVNDVQFQFQVLNLKGNRMIVERDGRRLEYTVIRDGRSLWLGNDQGDALKLEEVMPDIEATGESGQQVKNISSPLPGKIIKVGVKVGDKVKAGQVLVVIESMKMEHMLKAAGAGTVETLYHKEGEFIPSGKPILKLGKA